MYRDTIAKFAGAGAHKAQSVRRSPVAFLVGAAMAGAYIGFGDIIMFTVGAHADPAWSHLVMGSVFAAALTIVIFAGSELFTGTAMYMSFALLEGSSNVRDTLLVWIVCWIGNLVGAVVLAELLHLAGGGTLLNDGSAEFFSVVSAKINASGLELFVRGLLCNWLVCLAIWMCGRTDNDAAKIALIFWPIMIFVAAGFEHSVANMFTFATALLGEHPAGVTLAGAAHNLFWVTCGNIIGGMIMMGAGYWIQEHGIGHEGHATVTGTASPTPGPPSGMSTPAASHGLKARGVVA
jgi:nitrite transporter